MRLFLRTGSGKAPGYRASAPEASGEGTGQLPHDALPSAWTWRHCLMMEPAILAAEPSMFEPSPSRQMEIASVGES